MIEESLIRRVEATTAEATWRMKAETGPREPAHANRKQVLRETVSTCGAYSNWCRS